MFLFCTAETPLYPVLLVLGSHLFCAANVVFSLILYFVVYNFVLRQQVLPLGLFTLSSHIGALVIIFPFSNFFGFLLQKYVTFTESDLRGHVQLYRYFLIVFVNLGINAIVLKILVDGFHFWVTPSQMVATFFCIFISYFSQKKFTFKNADEIQE